MNPESANDDRLSDEELVSAYLDDALDEADRARAERLLKESAASRALLEELKTLRASLKDLPRMQVEAGFAERVLRDVDGQAAVSTKSVAAENESVKENRWLRPAAYAAFVVAASLLIMLFVPHDAAQKRQREVARLENAKVADDLREREAAEDARAPAFMAKEDASEASGPRDEYKAAPARTAEESLSKSGAGGNVASKKAGEPAPGSTPLFSADLEVPFREDEEQPYIVHVDVTPQAAKSRAFDNLLIQNSIELDKVEPAPAEGAKDKEALAADEKKQEAGKTFSIGGGAPASQKRAARNFVYFANTPIEEGADVVEVLATESQLGEVIQQMRDQKLLFQNIKVEIPAPEEDLAQTTEPPAEAKNESDARTVDDNAAAGVPRAIVQDRRQETTREYFQQRRSLGQRASNANLQQQEALGRARRVQTSELSRTQTEGRASQSNFGAAPAEQRSADNLDLSVRNQRQSRAVNANEFQQHSRRAIFVLRAAEPMENAAPAAGRTEAPAKAANP